MRAYGIRVGPTPPTDVLLRGDRGAERYKRENHVLGSPLLRLNMTKNNVEKKVFILITFPHHSLSSKEVRSEIQGRTLEAGADAESEVECWLPTGSSWLTQPASLHIPEPPAQVWHHSHWAGPSHINH